MYPYFVVHRSGDNRPPTPGPPRILRAGCYGISATDPQAAADQIAGLVREPRRADVYDWETGEYLGTFPFGTDAPSPEKMRSWP